jgi:hypothetical protein
VSSIQETVKLEKHSFRGTQKIYEFKQSEKEKVGGLMII